MNQFLNIVPVRLYLHCKGSSELPILVFFRFFCLMMWNPFSCLNLRENVYEQSPRVITHILVVQAETKGNNC